MPDHHLTRTGDDYAEALLDLLPQGQAWPKNDGSTLNTTVKGLCQVWGEVEEKASSLLERESDPRLTTEMLPDWERNWDLPDPCWSETLTEEDRRIALVQRMTIEGAQSREFFIEAAAQIGYVIRIREYRPFMCGIDRVGDNRDQVWDGEPVSGTFIGYSDPPYMIGRPENRFYWTVYVDEIRPNSLGSDLECLLNRWKPAQTEIVFNYSALVSGS